MKLEIHFLMALLLFADIHKVTAQGAKFFRISGPTATTITTFRADGTMVWSNAQPGAIYTVQTATSLPGETNWTGYVQFSAANVVNTDQLNAFNEIAGMVLIQAGVFTIGDTLLDGLSDAIPTNVTVSAFYMDQNLVSYSQWQSVYNWATNNGYSFANVGSGKAANHPVQTVDWCDTVKWCNARSQQAGLTPVYYTDAALTQVYTNGEGYYYTPYANWKASGYRLPTEAEWEKAARGGLSGARFPLTNVIIGWMANYYGCINVCGFIYDLGPNGNNTNFDTGGEPYTSPVGYFPPNGYKLYDMAGNVNEWCWDWYDTPPYASPGSPYLGGSDPHGPSFGNIRVTRGGDWEFVASYARCAYRNPYYQQIAVNFIGFRCVRGF